MTGYYSQRLLHILQSLPYKYVDQFSTNEFKNVGLAVEHIWKLPVCENPIVAHISSELHRRIIKRESLPCVLFLLFTYWGNSSCVGLYVSLCVIFLSTIFYCSVFEQSIICNTIFFILQNFTTECLLTVYVDTKLISFSLYEVCRVLCGQSVHELTGTKPYLNRSVQGLLTLL